MEEGGGEGTNEERRNEVLVLFVEVELLKEVLRGNVAQGKGSDDEIREDEPVRVSEGQREEGGRTDRALDQLSAWQRSKAFCSSFRA